MAKSIFFLFFSFGFFFVKFFDSVFRLFGRGAGGGTRAQSDRIESIGLLVNTSPPPVRGLQLNACFEIVSSELSSSAHLIDRVSANDVIKIEKAKENEREDGESTAHFVSCENEIVTFQVRI